jgi:hypothetical protein
MSHNLRRTVASLSPARVQVAAARDPRLFRVAGLPLLLAFVLALATALLTALQLDSLENEHLPALRDAQQLGETVVGMGVALRRSDVSRADSLADHFHMVAGATREGEASQSRMRSYDASFTDYSVSARRVAQGTSMSDEADLSSSESAKLASDVLKERLDAGIESGTMVVDATSAAAMKIRIAVCMLFALCAAVALTLFLPRRRASKERAEVPIERDAGQMAAAEGGVHAGYLQEAVRRMTEHRMAVAHASAQVAERNRQQVALLQGKQSGPTLTVIRADRTVLRTPVNASYKLGKRAAAGA